MNDTSNNPVISTFDGWLRVYFGDATTNHADYHWFWLRHQCDEDKHPRTGERTLDASDVSLGIRPRDVRLDDRGQSVLITWDEPLGRQSRYSLQWLRDHAYACNREAPPPPPSDTRPITVDAAEIGELGLVVNRALELARRDGVAVVRGLSTMTNRAAEEDTEPLIEAFGRGGLSIVGTHFGRIEDLRVDNTTNQNTDQLGYTDAGIDVHTDQPFLEHPPRYQLLQCIRTADSGGESFLCDALAAARYLASIDADAFARLTTFPVVFHRKQTSFERIVQAPIVTMDDPLGLIVRYSYFTLAPFKYPFAQMEAWYRAYDRFAKIVRDPRHQYRFCLQPGDFVLYDNHRMLHGRTAFSGPRWLRGIYFDEVE